MTHINHSVINGADNHIINVIMCATANRDATFLIVDSVARKVIFASHRSALNSSATRLETKVPNNRATAHPCC